MSNPKLSEIATTAPLSIICHTDDIEVENDDPNTEVITATHTLAMADKFTARTWELAQQDEDFKYRLGLVFPHIDIVQDERKTLGEYPVAIRHIVGLIICTNKAINTGKRPWWKYPETYLHPRSQTGLAELAASYIKHGKEDETVTSE
ncbi:hypothetical protein [Xanthomonas phage JGB6]|nr:hypothetical protein [Xanthomonas phage JGB6]